MAPTPLTLPRHAVVTGKPAGSDEPQLVDRSPLVLQLLDGGGKLGLAVVAEFETLDDLVLTVPGDARHAEGQALRDTVRPVGGHAHGDPVTLGRPEDQVVHVLHRGVGRRGGRRGAACLDDRAAPLGDGGDEGVLQPLLIVDHLDGRLAGDGGVGDVGVLGVGVVAPDDDALDVVDREAGLLGELGDRPVVVQAHQRGEPGGGYVRRVGAGDQGVGVRRVAGHQDVDVIGGVVVDGLALRGEDGAVGGEQVGAVHALAAGTGADQQTDVRTVEGHVGVVGQLHVGHQRRRAVFDLHRDTLERLHRRSDLQQTQLDGGLAEELTLDDAEQEAVGDVTGTAGDSHLHGGLRHGVLPCRLSWRTRGPGPYVLDASTPGIASDGVEGVYALWWIKWSDHAWLLGESGIGVVMATAVAEPRTTRPGRPPQPTPSPGDRDPGRAMGDAQRDRWHPGRAGRGTPSGIGGIRVGRDGGRRAYWKTIVRMPSRSTRCSENSRTACDSVRDSTS
ncbi:hypothetical protein SDC9_112062 [bioreactor metagenome]|uniref:Uncharacterized protein n=1 Tax=bioreactor metagenome TaxID=1076179 RepID=A0A645BI77_9ZZZZ